MSINGSSGSCHPSRDAELIPICNRLLTDLHVVRKMKLNLISLLLVSCVCHILINLWYVLHLLPKIYTSETFDADKLAFPNNIHCDKP